MRHALLFTVALTGPLAIAIALATSKGPRVAAAHETWNSSAAAHRVDARQTWWMNWPKARRDHDTACISCHTALPYALARPTLRGTLGEKGPSLPEQEMLAYVQKRVDLWDEIEPFYNDAKSGPRKTIESRGTESVLNALVLARYDADTKTMSPLTRKAFRTMWTMQLTEGANKGAWNWLNFHLSPWENDESLYYGATLATIALGETPASYLSSPDIQEHLTALRSYLTSNYEAQPLANKVIVLWASSRFTGLITPAQRTALLSEIQAHQQPDGGWSLARLGDWKRQDKTPFDTRSDGVATGLTVYALSQNGVASDTPEMQRAVAWLVSHQNAEGGQWDGYSVNKQRDVSADASQFMTDAASNYSLMALEAVKR